MVGSAIYRSLRSRGYLHILAPKRNELNLFNIKEVREYFNDNDIDLILLCAAKVGGIKANSEFKAEFIYENLQIQNNVINNAYISVMGCGYVGLSLGILLSKKNKVTFFDIDRNKIKKIKKQVSPINDDLISKYLLKNENIKASLNFKSAITNSEYIIIATPTDYDPERNYFNTESIENTIIKAFKYNSEAIIIIKSTIPLEYTEYLRNKFNNKKIIYSPEFLREGQALYDNLNPVELL